MNVMAVDIGNTQIHLGIFKGARLLVTEVVATKKSNAYLARALSRTTVRLAKKVTGIDTIIVCSVVPRLNNSVVSFLKKKWGRPVLIVGRDIQVPIKNNYNDPRQVGADRLVVSYAAKRLYGKPAIVIDMGTAMTFDIISAKGSYEGGMIFPGIHMSAESLFAKTALLPRVVLEHAPKGLIGKNTKDSILCGMYYGYGSLCRGIIELIKRNMGQGMKVIVTGGNASLVKKMFAGSVDKIDSDMVLKGLNLLVQKNFA